MAWKTIKGRRYYYKSGRDSQADLQHRKIDKAHARFLSSLRTLAQVRKLALPTLQVNIARNQVNVAETKT